MSRTALIEEIEKKHLRSDHPSFKVGDTISVHVRLIEGEKERIQVFTGTVIARRGSGAAETFAVYRIAYSTGMERVFYINSPSIAKIKVTRTGKVRRGKLYYLRGAFGKAAKVKERIEIKKKVKKVKAAKAAVEEVVPPAEEKTVVEEPKTEAKKKAPPKKKAPSKEKEPKKEDKEEKTEE